MVFKSQDPYILTVGTAAFRDAASFFKYESQDSFGNPNPLRAQGAANGPVAVRAILRTIRETEGMPEDEAFAVEAKIGMEVFASEDAKEGPRAFAEKRQPQFRDR